MCRSHSRFNRKLLCNAVLAGVAASVSPGLFAEEASDIHYLETVTVTAVGYEAQTLDTPHAVTVVDREAIEQSISDNVSQLLRSQPGISLTSDGAWGMNPVLRGLKKEQVVLMVDGMRMNSAQPYGAIASLVNLQQVERVEVVKGPVSVLYGSGAMGGVINLITRKADFSAEPSIQGQISLGGSSADEGLRGGVTLGLSNERHALNINAALSDLDDYEAADGEVELTGYEQKMLGLNYRFEVSEKGVLEVNAQKQTDDDVWYPGSRKLLANIMGTDVFRIIHSPKTERELYEVAYEHDFGGAAEIELRTNIWQQDIQRTVRAYHTKARRDIVRTEVTFSTTGVGAQLDLSPADSHQLIVGVDAWEMEGDPSRNMDLPPTFTTTINNDPFNDGEIRSAGLYLQDEVFFENWTVKAGIRVDRIEGDAKQAAGLPPGTKLDKKDTTTSWSVGAVYGSDTRFRPYINLGRAYRAADMRERFESSNRGDGYFHMGNPQLDPEVSTTLELGIKGITGDTRYAVAVYQSDIKDYIFGKIRSDAMGNPVRHPMIGSPIKDVINIDEVRIKGMEAEISHGLADNLAAFASLSYLRGDNKEFDEPMAEIPPAEMSFGLRYGAPTGLNWSVAARLVDKQDRVGEELTANNEDTTPGFGTVDMAVGYTFAGWSNEHSLRLTLSNLLDKGYHEHLTEGSAGYEPQAVGRNVYLGWTMGF